MVTQSPIVTQIPIVRQSPIVTQSPIDTQSLIVTQREAKRLRCGYTRYCPPLLATLLADASLRSA